MTTTITIANSKGGVGKTTSTVMFSYLLAKEGKKVLTIDFDPQADCTKMLYKTYNYHEIEQPSFYECIKDKDLKKAIVQLSNNHYHIPAHRDLLGFDRYVYSITTNLNKTSFFLDFLLEPLKEEYDFIFIDVPPTTSEKTNNAMVTSDYSVIIMQTHQHSYEQSIDFVTYLSEMQIYNPEIDLLGVVPYFVKKDGKVDKDVLKDANDWFGDSMFNNNIYDRQRVKLFAKNGIKNEDHHDQNTIDMYKKILEEIIERIEEENE